MINKFTELLSWKDDSAEEAEQWDPPIERRKERVIQLIEDGFVSGAGRGPPKEFEDRFADYVGADYCLAVNHGATALASAYYAVGVGPGDEVITPTVGYLGSYAGAMHLGARPVFCDIDPDTLLADPADAEQRITSRTKAINIVHMNGKVCDMDTFRELSDEYDIPLVVDASHAHGASWGDQKVGSVGDIACFSIQGRVPIDKPVAGGEGGIVTTNDRELYERQLSYCHLHRHGISDELTRPPYSSLDDEVLGRKWRTHPFALALADVSLDSLDYRIKKRTEFRETLFSALQDVPGIRPSSTYEKSNTSGLVWGLKLVYEPDELDGYPIESYVQDLREELVPVEVGFQHLEHQRYLFQNGYDIWGEDRGPLGGEFCGLPPFEPYEADDFPVATEMNERVITVPSFIEPRDGLLDRYMRAFSDVSRNAGS